MSKEYVTPLILELKPSAVYRFYLTFIYLLAAIAVVYADLFLLFQVSVVLFLIIFWFIQIRRAIPYPRLIWSGRNSWQLYKSERECVELHLTPMSFCASWLVILALETEANEKINITILPDSLDAEIFRQLRVRLRILKPKLLTDPDSAQADEDI